MKKTFTSIASVTILAFGLLLSSCSSSDNNNTGGNGVSSSDKAADSSEVAQQIPVGPQPGDTTYHFKGSQEIISYLDNSKDASKYKGGILYTIAREVPDYADKLIPKLKEYDHFIVVDKASMQVVLFDKYGQIAKSYGMACSKNFGTKHKKADNRTAEGFFSVEGVYDSQNWRYTNDRGYTSPARGVFGPKFIRLKIPVTRQIGIHGTSSPSSIGKRVSHGCIRLTNQNILELAPYAKVGMPVIVLPGAKDRAVNKQEGVNIPFFPLESKYAITDKELAKPAVSASTEKPKAAATSASKDSKETKKSETVKPKEKEKTSEAPEESTSSKKEEAPASSPSNEPAPAPSTPKENPGETV